jgi:hypothetical protein
MMLAASLMEVSILIPLVTGLVLVFLTLLAVILTLPNETHSDNPNHSVAESQHHSPIQDDASIENASWLRIFMRKAIEHWQMFWKTVQDTFRFIWLFPKVGYLVLTFLVSSVFPESEGIILQFLCIQLDWTFSQVMFSSPVSRLTTKLSGV